MRWLRPLDREVQRARRARRRAGLPPGRCQYEWSNFSNNGHSSNKDDYRLENAARMNTPESVDGCQQVSWRNILQKIICDGIFRINADEIQQELLILDDLEAQLVSLRASPTRSRENLTPSICQHALTDYLDGGTNSLNISDTDIQEETKIGNENVHETLDLCSRPDRSRIYELDLAVRVSQKRCEALLVKAHEHALQEKSSHQQIRLGWDEEKNNLLESIANLTKQLQLLDNDYNSLRTRYVNLQKSSRFFDSLIKLRCDEAESKTFDGHFLFELTSWPREKEQKKREIQDLRKQLHILSKQSKYQQEQLLLSRQEVDALFRAQEMAAEENRCLAESVLAAERSRAALERLCTEAASNASDSKAVTERLRARLAERSFAGALRVAKARQFASWKGSVRSGVQLRALGRVTRLITGRSGWPTDGAASQDALRAWLRRARGQRLIESACRNR